MQPVSRETPVPEQEYAAKNDTSLYFQNSNDLSPQSKCVMTTAALITNIFRKYLEQHRCPFVTDAKKKENWAANLLQHVKIYGGFCRDFLLNRPINNIDIVLDLEALCKLQRKHLRKYHIGTKNQEMSCQCVYWERFLRRFTVRKWAPEWTDQRHTSTVSEEEIAHRRRYTLNAKFWIHVLCTDEALKDKLSIMDYPEQGYTTVQITKPIVYGRIDCNQQRIDISDTFDLDKAFAADRIYSIGRGLTWKDDSAHQITTKTPMEAIVYGFIRQMTNDVRTLPADLLQLCLAHNQNIWPWVKVPEYSCALSHKLINSDFTINTCVLPLSNILQLKNSADVIFTFPEKYSKTSFKWRGCIKVEGNMVNGIRHCTYDMILKAPLGASVSVFNSPAGYVFFRAVRLLIQQHSFRIDPELLVEIQKDFEQWVLPGWFADVHNREMFIDFLVCTLERHCRNIDEVQRMLHIMDEKFQFTPLLASAMKQSRALRHSITKAIRGCNNANVSRDDIEQAFAVHKLQFSSDEELDEWLAEDARLDKSLFDAVKKLVQTVHTLDETAKITKRFQDDLDKIKHLTGTMVCTHSQERDARHEERSATEMRVAQLTAKANRLAAIAGLEADRRARDVLSAMERYKDTIESMSSQLLSHKQQIVACKKQFDIDETETGDEVMSAASKQCVHCADSQKEVGIDDEEKVQLLSTKQKQLNHFKSLLRKAKKKFRNKEYIAFQKDLKGLNDAVTNNKWTDQRHMMPKFWVKHMLEIWTELQAKDPAEEQNKQERQALQRLKRSFEQTVMHFKQIEIYSQKPEFWKKDTDSDLGEDTDDGADSDSDGFDDDDRPLYENQSADEDDDDGVKDTADKPAVGCRWQRRQL